MFERLKLAGQLAKAALFGKKDQPLSLSTLFGGIFSGMEVNKLIDYESYLTAGTRKCWALFRGCAVVSNVVMDTRFVLVKLGGDGTPVVNKEIDALLANPNEFENGVELLYKTSFHLKLTGNAFWYKDGANTRGDRPSELHVLNPKRVQIAVDPKEGITGYLYRPETGGQQIPFAPEEIMHFRIPHPNNDYWGLGDVESSEDLIQDYINRQAWGKKFWENGAAPSGLLVCEDMITNKQNFDLAKAQWQEQYGGEKNTGKTAWLTGKWRYEKIGLTSTEMESVEGSKWTVEQICMQLGVPLSVMGLDSSANYATARTDDLRFRRYTVKPLITFIEDTINSDLVDGFDAKLKLVFQVQGLKDLDSVVANYIPLFNAGAISLNELRVEAGFEPKKDDPIFDEHYINAGMVPLSLSGVAANDQSQAAAQQISQRFISRALLEK